MNKASNTIINTEASTSGASVLVTPDASSSFLDDSLSRPIELLAPAGDLVKLKIAVDYGADAVYFGGEMFSLRAGAGNLSIEEIEEGEHLFFAVLIGADAGY